MADYLADLRKQALARAGQAPESPENPTPDEVRRTLHELRVHQIELEMQNEELRRYQVELEASRANYFTLYDLAPVGYCTLSVRGLILEANLTLASLLGVTRSALTSQPLTRFIFRDDQNIFYLHRKKLFATGASQVAELRMVRADAQIIWVNLEATIAEDANGGVLCRLIVSDISARKQLSTYVEMGRDILAILNQPGELPEAFARVAEALKIQTGCDGVGIRVQEGEDYPYLAQSGFASDFLVTENSLIAKECGGGVCRDQDGKARLECTCGLVISGRGDLAHPGFTPGGSFWVNNSLPLLDLPLDQDPRLNPRNRCIHLGYASVALVPIRCQDRIVGLLQLNARRSGNFTLAAVARLEEIAAHLGAALLRRWMETALQKAAAELQRSNQDLEQFAYAASHDLQEPLRIISGFLGILQQRYITELDDKAKEYIGHCLSAAQRMSQLITDLLAYARVGQMPGLVAVDIGSALVMAMNNLQRAIAECGATVTSDKMPQAPANLREISQVFQNLIGNSLKFLRPGVAPEIHIGVERISDPGGLPVWQGDRGGQPQSQFLWLFSVSDNGLGVEPRFAERIFTIFQRLHSREQFPGSGVGLAICKKIVERHGGRIWVESAPGGGANFRFTLPGG